MPSEYDSDNTQQQRPPLGTGQAARERRPALVFLRGELMAVPIPLERDDVVLGRAVEADVRVNDFRASRLHARIWAEHDPETMVAAKLRKIPTQRDSGPTILSARAKSSPEPPWSASTNAKDHP